MDNDWGFEPTEEKTVYTYENGWVEPKKEDEELDEYDAQLKQFREGQ